MPAGVGSGVSNVRYRYSISSGWNASLAFSVIPWASCDSCPIVISVFPDCALSSGLEPRGGLSPSVGVIFAGGLQTATVHSLLRHSYPWISRKKKGHPTTYMKGLTHLTYSSARSGQSPGGPQPGSDIDQSGESIYNYAA